MYQNRMVVPCKSNASVPAELVDRRVGVILLPGVAPPTGVVLPAGVRPVFWVFVGARDWPGSGFAVGEAPLLHAERARANTTGIILKDAVRYALQWLLE